MPYLVQVGGLDTCTSSPCPESGTVVLRATSVRPLNDDRATPAVLPTGVPVTTSNVGASQERGEIVFCGPSRFAATVWYRWTAPGSGDAAFRAAAAFSTSANPSDTVLAVYRADSGARVGCSDDAGQPLGPSAVALRVAAGDYLLQIGAHGADGPSTGQGVVEGRVDFAPDADGDGASTLTDCNDANAGIRPGATEVAGNGIDEDCNGVDTALDPVQAARAADRDGDRYPAGVDCRDQDPTIHPGATDRPGDGVDQDCHGGDASYPALGAHIFAAWALYAHHTTFIGLAITRAPAKVRVKLTCAGKSCPFHTARKRIRRSTKRFDLLPLVRGAHLRGGVRLAIRLTRAGRIGMLTTWRVRPPKDPRRTDRCLVPGSSRPLRCHAPARG